MEQEISSGTMLGIVLIALAAVIGLGFGVFSIAKGVANEGTVGVQDNLGSVSDSAYDDYNDKIVTGTMVKSAIQNFKGKSCAILVNTTAMDKSVAVYNTHTDASAYASTAAGVFTMTAKVAVDSAKKTLAAPADKGHNYINYNALLDGTAGALKLENGTYTATALPFKIDLANGKVLFDYNIGGLSRTGNCEYLNATAKFDANLIKDETGTTIGIVFTQRVQ